MSAPKSVTKVLYKKGKTEVTFTDDVDPTMYHINELSRRALNDVGNFIKKKFKELYYSHFHKRTGEGPKAVYFKVYSSKSTQYPRLDIGLPHSKRGKAVEGYYSFFQEFGSSKTPRLGLLTHSVEDNIATIIEIESKYLKHLEEEASKLSGLINENDMEDKED